LGVGLKSSFPNGGLKIGVIGIDKSEARELGLRWEHLAEMRSIDVGITLVKGKGDLWWVRRGRVLA
jgi:hypothetical protein